MNEAVLLPYVRDLVATAREQGQYHPGLTLDKHLHPGDQKSQKQSLDLVCRAESAPNLLRSLAARRDNAWPPGTIRFNATTSGPLTLHLSRATALENAGIALHPLYGFAYLPGSGLKGAARAFAETIWRPAQPDKSLADKEIRNVFGCAPEAGPRPGDKIAAQAGAVVFHDAWPETWPRLFVDIAAIHHPEYYQAPDANVPPPGDWEEPTPVNFLAIPADTKFCFSLTRSAAGKAAEPAVLERARDWLNGALTTLGIGAKTAAGYGYFTSENAKPASAGDRATAQFKLRLVTPAFLAGADRDQSDCDLRGATIRGQLRWWWRTMHAAHLASAELRRLESALWGASSTGSALQLRLTSEANPTAEQFVDKVKKEDGKPGDNIKFIDNIKFLDDNRIERSNSKVPAAERQKTTQGLYYAAFGAGFDRANSKKGRFFRQPGSAWSLQLTARDAAIATDGANGNNGKIPAEMVLKQAKAAVFLLTRFGGVGAKSRNGFGSLADCPCGEISSIEDCHRLAKALRSHCCLIETQQADAPALERMSSPVVVATRWTNAWFAVNRIGEAMQSFANTGKHQAWKAALGLPRRSDHPSAVRVGNKNRHEDDKELRPYAVIPGIGRKQLTRFASPILYHVAEGQRALEVRLVTFVSRHLPDETTSRSRLAALRTHVEEFLVTRANEGGTAPLSPAPTVPQPVANDGKPQRGSKVQAILLEGKTKGGGWRARDCASGEQRSIQNSHRVPADKVPGDIVTLEVPNNEAFKWPVAPPPPPSAPIRLKGRR